MQSLQKIYNFILETAFTPESSFTLKTLFILETFFILDSTFVAQRAFFLLLLDEVCHGPWHLTRYQ